METESESFELIIILALVAVFILFQLRRTLGKKGGYDPSQNQGERPSQHSQPQNNDDNVVQIRPDSPREAIVNLGLSKSSPFYAAIEKINNLDPSFNLRSFYDGAEYAYGVVLTAFWEQDRKILRGMLSREVFEQFDGAIDQQEQQKHHNKNKLMDIEKIDLLKADLTGTLAELTVEFTSHMIMTTLDGDGKIITGDQDRTVKITDIWTFCRDVKSRDPNWTLVGTKTG